MLMGASVCFRRDVTVTKLVGLDKFALIVHRKKLFTLLYLKL